MIDKDRVIHDLVARDSRFRAEAYDFVFESLDYTLRRRGGGARHVTGSEILESIRLLALEQFGYLARSVLAQWGITSTTDFGDVVFNLIEADLLQKTANDRREDFVDLYEFGKAFDIAFHESIQTVEL